MVATSCARPHHGVDRTRRSFLAEHLSDRHDGSPSIALRHVSAGTDGRQNPRPYTASRGGTSGRRSGETVLTDADRRRPRRRGLGQRWRAAHRQRRQGDPHQRWRTHHGYNMPADEDCAVTSTLSGSARTPERGRHRCHQRRGQRHRDRLDHQGAVQVRPRSSPWSAPSASVARRTRRHHVGVLRDRDCPDGLGMPASSTASG
jgi:hypothetical protein